MKAELHHDIVANLCSAERPDKAKGVFIVHLVERFERMSEIETALSECYKKEAAMKR